MPYAILADVHGQLERLQRVLADAQRQGATHVIALGDIGTNACHDLLRRARARAVFGNYEVSQRANLSSENRAWVEKLPSLLMVDDFMAAHAAPYLPDDICTLDQVYDRVLRHGVKWRALFPRLDQDEDARRLAYAELVSRGTHVFFHGHTHVQAVWRVRPDGMMALISSSSVPLDGKGRYIVGVGSVGHPEDGPEPRYAIYAPEQRLILLRRVALAGGKPC